MFCNTSENAACSTRSTVLHDNSQWCSTFNPDLLHSVSRHSSDLHRAFQSNTWVFHRFSFAQAFPLNALFYRACHTTWSRHENRCSGQMQSALVASFFLKRRQCSSSQPLFSYFSLLHKFCLLTLLFFSALCKLLAGNRRSVGCESPIDFGKRRVSGITASLSFCAFVSPSTNTLWSLISSWFYFISPGD